MPKIATPFFLLILLILGLSGYFGYRYFLGGRATPVAINLIGEENDTDAKSLTDATPNQIVLLKTGKTGTYTYKLYRHTAHTCAKSGYQTFLLIHRTNDDLTQPAPLLVRLHGGGAGFFNENGEYRGSGWINQENEDVLLPYFQESGLVSSLKGSLPSLRYLVTSMCDHDYRLGNGTVADPNNPHSPDENGNPRTADGLISDLKALLYVTKTVPTNKFFIHGTSAGAYGAFGLSAQLSMNNPTNARLAGVILDSAVADWSAWQIIGGAKESCGAIQESVRPRLGKFGLDAYSAPTLFSRLVTQGKWKVPLYLTYSTQDIYGCGHKQITYTKTNGQTVTESGTTILYRSFSQLIKQYNPGNNSFVAAMCVGANCDRHVPTETNLSDSLRSTGNVNYNAQLTQWLLNLP